MAARRRGAGRAVVFTVRRAAVEERRGRSRRPAPRRCVQVAARAPTRWSPGQSAAVARADIERRELPRPSRGHDAIGRRPRCTSSRSRKLSGRAAYVAGTFDTKGRELAFIRNCLEKLGLRTVTVDLRTSGKPSPADVGPARGGAPSIPKGAARRLHRRPRHARWPRWPRPSSASSARAATSAASSPPAARAAPRSPRRPCGACRSACPR